MSGARQVLATKAGAPERKVEVPKDRPAARHAATKFVLTEVQAGRLRVTPLCQTWKAREMMAPLGQESVAIYTIESVGKINHDEAGRLVRAVPPAPLAGNGGPNFSSHGETNTDLQREEEIASGFLVAGT